jgi:hypothetical protein
MKTLKTYFVISTTNAQVDGWLIFGQGSKEECKKIQLNNPAFQGTDIYSDTLNKNSRIVSKTEAKKKFKLDV